MRFRPNVLFLLTRRVHIAVSLLMLIGILVAVSVSSEYGFEGRGGAVTPVVLLVPIAMGCAIGVSSGSVAPDIERLAGERLRVAERALVAILTIVAATIASAAILVGLGSLSSAAFFLATVLARVSVFFGGAALIGRFIFGHNYSWVVPVLFVPFITYFWVSSDGVHTSWNPANLTTVGPASWILTITIFSVGFLLTGSSVTTVWNRAVRR